MVAQGEDGVLMRCLGRLRWGCGKTLGVGGGSFLDLLGMRCEMGLKAGFGMICGVVP
jgi:hypothetical protein